MTNLFGEPLCPPGDVGGALDRNHYLGRTQRGLIAWNDEHGIAVLGRPTTRHLPSDWLELQRWCLRGEPNDGSRQWSKIVKHLRAQTTISTVVSYSDPSVGHTGALYRACNWWWAPTWMRIVPPPSRGGSWDGVTPQEVKDRWVFALRRDPRRIDVLRLEQSYIDRFPWAEYREPGGADWKGQP